MFRIIWPKSHAKYKNKRIITPDEIKRSYTNETEEKAVINFYESDDISKVCPGKRDCEIVLEIGIKIEEQKSV